MYTWMVKLFDKFNILSLCCFNPVDSDEEYISLLKKRIADLISEFNDCVSHQQILQSELERVRNLIEQAKKRQYDKNLNIEVQKSKCERCA